MLGAEEKMGVVWIFNICRHGKGLGPGAAQVWGEVEMGRRAVVLAVQRRGGG